MSAQNESSFAGKKLIVNDPNFAGSLQFNKLTSETKTLLLPANGKPKQVMISTAGHTDFSIRVSRDSMEAISENHALWGAAALYGNRNGDLYLGEFPSNIRAIEVTCVKTAASAADNATKQTEIGARVEVRAVSIDAMTSGEAAAPVSALTEMAVD